MAAASIMAYAQRHRGPDSPPATQRFWGRGDDQVCELGHTRLKIIDLSDNGAQPMASADGKKHIVFNGEIYNYKELRQEISDYPYRSQTDTEVILAAYERWGEACVQYFNGMFAFAIWDQTKQKLFLARDRLGIKPLFYAFHDGGFYFASEVQALLAAGVPADPNYFRWADFLTEGYYDHSSTTLFKSILSLEPGHTLSASPDVRVVDNRYWYLPDEIIGRSYLDSQETVDDYRELLEDSVRLRLRADVPIGLNLSGGLDSSVLASIISEIQVVDSFSMGFSDPSYNEITHALEAIIIGGQLVTNLLEPEGVPGLSDNLIRQQAAPFGGISTLAYYDLHRMASLTNNKVLIEGQGADEVLGGYAYYQDYERPDSYQDGTKALDRETVNPEVTELAGALSPKPFNDSATNMMYRDLRYTKLPRVLRMNDHLSMAHGIELREPYLDHRLVEFAFSLPLDMKIRNGQTKWILREAMKNRLPDSIRLAPKRAVVTPQREWMRGPLKPWVDEIIHSTSFAQRGLFNVPAVHKAWERYCNQGADNSFFVWQWICTEFWFRQFQDAKQVDIPKTGMLVS